MSFDNDTIPNSLLFSQLQHSINPAPPVSESATYASQNAEQELNGNHSPEVEPVAAPEIDLANEESFPALKPSAKRAFGGPTVSPVSGFQPKISKGGSIPVQNKVTERFEIPANLQAKQLGQKSTVGEVCKQIMKKSNTAIEFSTVQKTGTMFFLVTGKAEDVKVAKRQIMNQISKPTSHTISIPSSVRPHLVGAGGKNLKALIAKTMTRIDIPKSNPNANPDEDEEQLVTITGDFEGVEIATKEIEQLISLRASKHIAHMNVEYSFHPFIQRDLEVPETVKVEYASAAAEADKKNSIVLRGDRSDVIMLQQKITELVEHLQRVTNCVQIEVNKRQHRFVVGPQGSVVQEIFKNIGCSIDVPAASDPSISIKARGPSAKLPSAMTLILEKANSVQFAELNLVTCIPADVKPDILMRYINVKERAAIKTIETDNNATIVLMSSSSSIEVQARSVIDVEKAMSDLRKNVITWSTTLYFSIVEVPRFLHKYCVGKGGQNITKLRGKPEMDGRFIDALFAPESDESDEVVVIINRIGKEDPKKFAEKVKDELIKTASAMEDFVTESLKVDQKYHGRLIGAGGATVKEIKGSYSETVQIKFPPSSSQKPSDKKEKRDPSAPTEPDVIVLRGPRKEVAEIKERITKLVAEWKHSDVLNNQEEKLTLPKGIAKRLLASQQSQSQSQDPTLRTSNTTWLVNAVIEQIQREKLKVDISGLTPTSIRVDITEANATTDNISVFGPKTVVTLAKAIMAERGKKLADFTVVEINLFESVGSAAKKVLQEETKASQGDERTDMKNKILRRVIGREGRFIKKLSEKHNVTVKFLDGRKKDAEEADEDADAGEEGAVLIKGSKSDVEACKKELLEFVENEILNSYVLVFNIPSSTLPYIVGRGGSKVSKIKDDNNVRIDFVDLDDSMVEVVIEGAKNKCFDARKEIDAVVDERVNTETIVLLIPASLHKVIIGSGGVRIKKLVEHFGGQDKVKIQFPRSGSTGVVGDAITIRANKKLLPTIRAELDNALAEALNEESDSSSKANGVKAHRVPIFEVEADVTEEGVVSLDGDDANSYGKNSIFELITLSKGDTPRNNMVKELMRKFGAAVILLPHESDSSQVVVKIVVHKGEEASIALIKKEIQANVRVATKVKIPENIMSTLERQGSGHDAELSALNEVARRIRADHGVSVDISKSEGNLEIRGDQKKSQRAVIAAEAALAELGKHTASAQLPVAPHLRPHIIGRMGATITKIREKTGTHVEIVRGKNAQSDDIVMFRGDSESVEAAKAMVEEIVSKQEERARNEKIQTASKSAQTLFTASPARSSNLSAARIDDDPSEVGSNSDVAESNGVRHVPGFHGRVNKKDVPRPQTGNVTSGGYLSSAAAYESANKADDNQWQVQKGRKPKKVEEDDLTGLSTDGNAENTANGDGVNKKKKKKKGKAGASTSATEEATPPSSAAAVQLVPPTPVPTPNFAESPKPEVSHKPAQKVTATPVKPTTQQVKTETTTVATIEKDYVVVEDISETEVVDDGWITPVRKSKPAKNNDGVTPVSQVGSIPSAASVLIDESASKKKKNKKKKTGGAEVNGQ